MPTLSLFEQHRRAGPSFYQEAHRGESMVPFGGGRTTDGCWLRGDARDTKGTNPMASQGGCCRSGPIHPADPRHCRLMAGLVGLSRGLSTLFATDPNDPLITVVQPFEFPSGLDFHNSRAGACDEDASYVHTPTWRGAPPPFWGRCYPPRNHVYP